MSKEYSDYIAQLEKRNRDKKRKEDSDPNKILKEREKGFNTCFSGANKELGGKKSKSKTTVNPSTQNPPQVTFYATTDVPVVKPNQVATRKQWNNPTATLKPDEFSQTTRSETRKTIIVLI